MPPLDLPTAAAPILAAVEARGFAARVASRAGVPAAGAARAIADVVSEARLALDLLSRPPFGPLDPDQRVLEVGAGAGLVTAILGRAGARTAAIEPLIGGFDLFAAIRAELAAEVEVPTIDRRAAIELSAARDGRFDRIFSINVLEHCHPLDPSLDAIAAVLAPGGVMIHTCPNYRVPYEPHFGLPLVPLAPAWTARLVPRLASDPLWQSLNWITAGDLTRFARRAGLVVHLVPGIAAGVVARLARDPAFARRQGWAGRVAAVFARTGALDLVARLPPAWLTPLVAVFERPAPA